MVTQEYLCLKTANIGHEIANYDRRGVVRRQDNNLSVDQALSNLLWKAKFHYSFHEDSVLEPDLN
jgi:hypothetical protein